MKSKAFFIIFKGLPQLPKIVSDETVHPMKTLSVIVIGERKGRSNFTVSLRGIKL